MKPWVTRFSKTLRDFARGAANHDLLTLSAALSFYTALSIAPLLLILLVLVGNLGVDVKPTILPALEGYLGTEASAVFRSIIENTKKHAEVTSLAGWLGVLMLLFSASSVFAQLQFSLNVIWHGRERALMGLWEWIQHRLLSAAMVIVVAFFMGASLILNAVAGMFFPQTAFWWKAVNNVASLVMFTGIFTLLFKFLPSKKVQWQIALKGGAVTSVLFAIGKVLIELYLANSALASAYGAAGSLILLLLWIYYSALIFFLGAEWTRALTKPLGAAQK